MAISSLEQAKKEAAMKENASISDTKKETIIGGATNVSALPPTNLGDKKEEEKFPKAVLILSSVGFLGGLTYAFIAKKEFWGYVGFGFLGSIAGSAIGGIIYQISKKK